MLGVRHDASEDEIKRAYRKAAMRWHPDRNIGPEDVARAAFQEIKDAYAILSDPVQRQVYDDVFAEEMRRWEQQRQREEQLRAEHEAAALAAAEAEYARMVTLAMRFASDEYNRDIMFGALLGQQCEAALAKRIADSVWALHESRQAAAADYANRATSPTSVEPDGNTTDDDAKVGTRPISAFQTLWHNFFGIPS